MTVLKDLLRMEDLTPFVNNVVVAQLAVLTYKVVFETISRSKVRERTGWTSYSKQYMHMTLASTVVFWPLYDTTDWSWRLNVLLPAALAVRLIYKVCVQ